MLEPFALRIPLSAPDIGSGEIQAVVEVLRSGRLSLGPWLEEFERIAALYLGARRAVAVSSGTAGLHLCAIATGLGEGDEVVTTPFSFIASANTVLYTGARPIFVDIDPRTLNMDPDRIEKAITPRTKAILVVHIFGRPAPMKPILEIAARRGLRVLEDACEALGGEYRGGKLGTLGDAGVYAFYPNKQITTGEGGLIVTDDSAIADRVAVLRNQGRSSSDPSEHSELGYNYRLSEMQCALGSEQFKRLETILQQRAEVAHEYRRRLAGHPHLILPEEQIEDGRISWFVYVVRLGEHFTRADRDWIVNSFIARGIGCGRYFPVIPLQSFYRRRFGYREGDFPVAEHVSARTLALPFFNRITEEEIEEVCESLLELCGRREQAAVIPGSGRNRRPAGKGGGPR